MKNKGLKILIIIAIALALIMAGVVLVKESGMDTSKIQEVYIEVITEEGSIERIQVTDTDDVEFIKVSFNGETTPDGEYGFVEGGYRLILAQPDKEWHLYPREGDLSCVRIGDSGDKYLVLAQGSDELRELTAVVNKYIDTSDYEEEYNWKEVIMNEIKN